MSFRHAWLLKLIEQGTTHLFVRDPSPHIVELIAEHDYAFVRECPTGVFIFRRRNAP